MIGQFSDPFEQLNLNSLSLLEVCQNDVYLAYDKWLHLLGELESVTESAGINLKGTKFWFSVFWNKDGTIKHFAYYPKQGSKEIDLQKLQSSIYTLIADYKMPIGSVPKDYYNYGSGAFPLPDRKQTARK